MEADRPPQVPNEEQWRERTVTFIRGRIIDVCENNSREWRELAEGGLVYRSITLGDEEWEEKPTGIKLVAETFKHSDGRLGTAFLITKKENGLETVYIGERRTDEQGDVEKCYLVRIERPKSHGEEVFRVAQGGELELMLSLVHEAA